MRVARYSLFILAVLVLTGCPKKGYMRAAAVSQVSQATR